MSTALSIRESGGIETLSDAELFARIEKSLDGLRVYLEEAVRRGWTQARIGEALGVSQPRVSQRMKDLGIEPKQPHKPVISRLITSDGSEVLDGEIVDELPSVRTNPVTVGGVKFPSTAGGIAVPRDISVYAVADLKKVANDLIRRATPQEAKALHYLFITYAEKAGKKAAL